MFTTFPWPQPTQGQRARVGEAIRQLIARRSSICQSQQIGLTTLYNAVEDGAWADLAALHRQLDVAVAAAYGWPAAVAQQDLELVQRLGKLNMVFASDPVAYQPF